MTPSDSPPDSRPDSPADAKLARMLARLGQQAEAAPYWAYAIRDPLTGDRRDWTTGEPVHVGQTNDPVRRARAHLATEPGAEEEPGTALALRIQAILRAGRVPVFDLLEPAPTRLAALAAETRWIRRLRAEGHPLDTSRPDNETQADAELGETGVPLSRVWTLTLAEAGEADLTLGIGCESCGLDLPLPTEALATRTSPQTRLATLRDALDCPNCGRSGVLQVTAPGG